MASFIDELSWRGMIQETTPGLKDQLSKESTTAYIGFDPTADSLHIGNLVPIILLKHFQNYGHKPIALIGGATGMIGDPSGKSDERNLLTEEQLAKNIAGVKANLSRFISFEDGLENKAQLVNNMDWMKDFSFIEFARDVGKRITVNYMMAKDSVKKRIGGDSATGMSFTEFTYQLIQGYDFFYLNKNYNCKLQMGGSDQWGNMTTGTELVRRMTEGKTEAFALTCPLTTKADGSKFGKSEKGNIWLDEDKTSVYEFYQFWLNTSDEDAEKFIKIYTFLAESTITELVNKHNVEPHLRLLQQSLAEEVTRFVHGEENLQTAIKASKILFGKSTTEDLKSLNEKTFLSVFAGVPSADISIGNLEDDIMTFLSESTGFLKSKSEARRALKENSISINKQKISEDFTLSEDDLITDKYILLQRGKKSYFLVSLIK